MVFTTEIEKAEISLIKFPLIFSILNQELTYLVYVTVIFIAKVFRIASRTFCIVIKLHLTALIKIFMCKIAFHNSFNIIYFIIGIFNESDFIFCNRVTDLIYV